MRGNNRQNIFNDTKDFIEFFRTLSYTYEKYPFTIASYCVMTNHYHLLLLSPKVHISKIMHLINRRYSYYYKKKYDYSGHLYENRYFSELIHTPKAMLTVSRYIHRNPINTKTPMVEKMENYPYSSYSLFKYNQPSPFPFVDTNSLLDCLQYPTLQTREDYLNFCETEVESIIGENPQNHTHQKHFSKL